MDFLVFFAISSVVFGFSSAFNEEMRARKIEEIIHFYQCISCGPHEAHEAYARCHTFKPEPTKKRALQCANDLNLSGLTEEDYFHHMCEHPEAVEEIFGCLLTEDYFKSLTTEDKVALKQFKECTREVHDQYCEHY